MFAGGRGLPDTSVVLSEVAVLDVEADEGIEVPESTMVAVYGGSTVVRGKKLK